MIRRSAKFRAVCFAALLALALQPAHARHRIRRMQQNQRAAAAKQNAEKPKAAQRAKQTQKPSESPRPAESAANKPNAPAAGQGQGQPNLRNMAGLPPKWVEQLRDLSPEEQQRFMQNNARFRSLPPERQEQIRQNLQKWNQLTPEQRNDLRIREDRFERLTPEQKQYVRQTLLPRWQAMPFERRQLIRGRLRVLNNMPPAQREAKLNDPAFMYGLSPDEQQTLRDLNSFRNPIPPQ